MGLRKSYSYIENTQQVFEQNSQPTLTIEFKIRIRISNTHLLRLRVQHMYQVVLEFILNDGLLIRGF